DPPSRVRPRRRGTHVRPRSASRRPAGRAGRSPDALQDRERVPLLLARPAADRGELDGSRLTTQVARSLDQTHHSPPDGAGGLPPEELGERDLAAPGGAIGVDQGLIRPHSRDWLRSAEPPRGHAQVAEVLQRVAHVDELPIEHGGDPVLVDQEVSEAEVTVHDGLRPRLGTLALEPTQNELKRGMRDVEAVEHLAATLDWVLRLELRERVLVDRAEPRQDLPAARGEGLAGGGKPGVPKDPLW